MFHAVYLYLKDDIIEQFCYQCLKGAVTGIISKGIVSSADIVQCPSHGTVQT
jgi:hypothetical protein